VVIELHFFGSSDGVQRARWVWGHDTSVHGTYLPCLLYGRATFMNGPPHQLYPSFPPHPSLPTTMSLEAVLSYIRSLRPGESFSYRKVAKKNHISRTTLAAHHQGRRTTRAGAHDQRRLLPQREELELVKYIRSLTEKHCPPTRQMIINFVTPLVRWEPSEAWVSKLLHRHPNELITCCGASRSYRP
jgi:hypothetical protein